MSSSPTADALPSKSPTTACRSSHFLSSSASSCCSAAEDGGGDYDGIWRRRRASVLALSRYP
eukprot:5091131-Lingulodinium_polyedra.AAC.1